MPQTTTHTASNPLPQQYNATALGLDLGYSYFGARYYDPDLSVWLSVDPIIKENESPYLYCAGNPIQLTDPNGKDWVKTGEGDYKHDANVNKDSKLKDGQKYIGKSADIRVNDSEGKELYSVGLNEDGSMTDKMGVKHEKGFGEYDAGFKSGAKILSNKQDGNKRATVNSDINAAGVYGLGLMADYGTIEDSYDAEKGYFQIGLAIGFGGSAGTGKSITNKKVRANDFEGVSVGFNSSMPGLIVGPSMEGYMDVEHGGVRDYYGNNVKGVGGNLGVGQAWFVYLSYTFVFD